MYAGVYCVSWLSKFPEYIDNITDMMGKTVTRKAVYAKNDSQKKAFFTNRKALFDI